MLSACPATLLAETWKTDGSNSLYAKAGDEYFCLAYYDVKTNAIVAFDRYDELRYMNVTEISFAR